MWSEQKGKKYFGNKFHVSLLEFVLSSIELASFCFLPSREQQRGLKVTTYAIRIVFALLHFINEII